MELPVLEDCSTEQRSTAFTFVDQTTGVHTQNRESNWNQKKKRFKRMKGCMLVNYPAISTNSCGGRNTERTVWKHGVNFK